MFDLTAVQAALRSFHLDGWLLYDFRGLNVLACRVVGFPENPSLSRRWFYFVPAERRTAQARPSHRTRRAGSSAGTEADRI